MHPQPLPEADNRPAQAARVADYLEANPHSTQKEIDAACDTGCISKVLSDMPRDELPGMGYRLRRQLGASLRRYQGGCVVPPPLWGPSRVFRVRAVETASKGQRTTWGNVEHSIAG